MEEFMKKFKLGYTSGVYDMFHIGHLNILKNAKSCCEKLIVGVTTDKLCFERKNKYPIICQEDRAEIVKAIKYVDEVVFQENMNKFEMVQKLGVDAVFVGSDWKGSKSWNEYEQEFKKIGVEVVYLNHTDGISSTLLREKIKKE